MKKSLTVTILACLCSMLVSAQQIKKTSLELNDIIDVLELQNYAFSKFDISDLKDKSYNISFYIAEYDSLRTEPIKKYISAGENRSMISDFPERFHEELRAEALDSAKLVAYLANFISLAIIPQNDSIRDLAFNIENMSSGLRSLNLKHKTSRNKPNYIAAPFIVNETIEISKDIPLMLLGSMWYDAENGFYRFCGESEIAPDMSSEILKNIPHYYVIGVRFDKQ